jgi:hypothetical protein
MVSDISGPRVTVDAERLPGAERCGEAAAGCACTCDPRSE